MNFVEGTGFDPASSIYTAPVAGYYFFSAQVRDDGDMMSCYIMHNNEYAKVSCQCNWFKNIWFQNKLDCQQAQSLRVAFQKKKIYIAKAYIIM